MDPSSTHRFKYSEHQEKATSASFAIDSASTSSAPLCFALTFNALQSNARKQRTKPFFDTMDKCENVSTYLFIIFFDNNQDSQVWKMDPCILV